MYNVSVHCIALSDATISVNYFSNSLCLASKWLLVLPASKNSFSLYIANYVYSSVTIYLFVRKNALPIDLYVLWSSCSLVSSFTVMLNFSLFLLLCCSCWSYSFTFWLFCMNSFCTSITA